MTKEIVEAVGVLEREKGISADRLMAALEDALLSAYKKTPGAAKYARVEVDRSSGDFRVYELLLPPDLEEQLLDEVEEEAGEPTVDPETGEMVYPEPPEIDQERLAQYRDQIEERDVTPDDFGRIAAQTAKQVILQRIREAERDMMFNEYQDRVGELITGIVQQSDSRYTLVQLRERVEALLPRGEQVHGERYDHGQRVKAIITDVSNQAKGPSIIVSRRSPELIRALFELEVPEIADGLVEIQNVAREPGYRSKIAVVSHASGVDPVGACVGPRGSRVRMVVSELRGEKIDIIPFNEEPARFVAKALSPARVREVLVDDEAKQATVIVPDDQLSLGDRQGRTERAAGGQADRLARGHPLRDRVRRGGVGAGLHRGGRGRPLRLHPRERQALPERLAARLPLLRAACAPGARGHRHRLPRAARGGARSPPRTATTSWRQWATASWPRTLRWRIPPRPISRSTRSPSPRRSLSRRTSLRRPRASPRSPRTSPCRGRARRAEEPLAEQEDPDEDERGGVCRGGGRPPPRRRRSRRALSPLRRLRALASQGRAAAAGAGRGWSGPTGPGCTGRWPRRLRLCQPRLRR